MPIKKQDFEVYEQVILTEQMPQERVPIFLEENQEFAEWYKERRAIRKITDESK